jgi:hypothetical protein
LQKCRMIRTGVDSLDVEAWYGSEVSTNEATRAPETDDTVPRGWTSVQWLKIEEHPPAFCKTYVGLNFMELFLGTVTAKEVQEELRFYHLSFADRDGAWVQLADIMLWKQVFALHVWQVAFLKNPPYHEDRTQLYGAKVWMPFNGRILDVHPETKEYTVWFGDLDKAGNLITCKRNHAHVTKFLCHPNQFSPTAR